MISFVLKRLGQMVVTFVLTSFICFVLIQLPPNDLITRRMQTLESMGATNIEAAEQSLKKIYHLDKPMVVQYVLWISGFVKGDFGYSLFYQTEARDLILQRLPFNLLIALPSLMLAYVIAISLGLYSAVHQYSLLDHVFTFFGLLGLAVPSFLLALFLLLLTSRIPGMGVGGLFSPNVVDMPWSLSKALNLLEHMWPPVLALTVFYAAGLMRIMRAQTLDLLHEPFVIVARSKGLTERTVVLKHVLRLAVNPLISIAGLQISEVVSGGVMVAIVLNLPTLGPLLLVALLNQDMYLGGAIIMIFVALLLAGNFLADLALAFLDPRIRFD